MARPKQELDSTAPVTALRCDRSGPVQSTSHGSDSVSVARPGTGTQEQVLGEVQTASIAAGTCDAHQGVTLTVLSFVTLVFCGTLTHRRVVVRLWIPLVFIGCGLGGTEQDLGCHVVCKGHGSGLCPGHPCNQATHTPDPLMPRLERCVCASVRSGRWLLRTHLAVNDAGSR